MKVFEGRVQRSMTGQFVMLFGGNEDRKVRWDVKDLSPDISPKLSFDTVILKIFLDPVKIEQLDAFNHGPEDH